MLGDKLIDLSTHFLGDAPSSLKARNILALFDDKLVLG